MTGAGLSQDNPVLSSFEVWSSARFTLSDKLCGLQPALELIVTPRSRGLLPAGDTGAEATFPAGSAQPRAARSPARSPGHQSIASRASCLPEHQSHPVSRLPADASPSSPACPVAFPLGWDACADIMPAWVMPPGRHVLGTSGPAPHGLSASAFLSGRRGLRERRLQQQRHRHASPGRPGPPQPGLPQCLRVRQQLLPQPRQSPHRPAPGEGRRGAGGGPVPALSNPIPATRVQVWAGGTDCPARALFAALCDREQITARLSLPTCYMGSW